MFEYKVNEHNYFIIQRAYHEYESHVRVLRFMLSESVCNDVTFSDDIWDYWYNKTIEADILRHYLLGYVVNNMFGEVPTFYTISDDATSIYTVKNMIMYVKIHTFIRRWNTVGFLQKLIPN